MAVIAGPAVEKPCLPVPVPYLVRAWPTWHVADQASLKPSVVPIGSYRGGRLFRVRFYSHTVAGQDVRIFGYYGVPGDGCGWPAPGLVVIHGGGGYATLDRVRAGMRAGFATLAIDLPGKGSGRARSRSTGPDMSVRNIFRTDKLELNYLANAVRAVGRAVTFLESRPEVDAARLYLFGISWGGVTSLLETSVDRRICAAVDLFGAGYIVDGSTWHDYLARLTKAERVIWREAFDPSRYLRFVRAPVFMVTGTNDNCYWLPNFIRTYHALRQYAPAMLLLRPGLDHRLDDFGRAVIWRWLKLQASGQQGECRAWVECAVRLRGSVMEVEAEVHGGQPVAGAIFWAGAGENWTDKRWQASPCPPAGKLQATIPAPATDPIYFFALAQLANGLAVSSPVYTARAVTAFGKPVAAAAPCICPAKFLVKLGWLQSLATRARVKVAPRQPADDKRLVYMLESYWEPLAEATRRLKLRASFKPSEGIRIVAPRGSRPQLGRQGEGSTSSAARRAAAGRK